MDITGLLTSLGIEYRRHGSDSEVTENFVGVRCPLCSPQGNRFKLGIPLRNPFVATCWTCGKVKLWDFLAAAGVSPRDCKERFGLLDQGVSRKKEVAGKLEVPKAVVPMGKAHRAYLRKRGLDPELIESTWGVQGIGPDGGYLKWRLYIPIAWRGKPVSWTTRAISDEVTPKYRTAKPEQEKIHAKTLLYGHDLANHACIVVEGPGDAWRIGPGAVATMGTVVTRAQMAKLSRFSLRIICMDSDPAAQRRANTLAGDLSVFDGETLIVRLDSPDPGSATDKEVRQLRRMLR